MANRMWAEAATALPVALHSEAHPVLNRKRLFCDATRAYWMPQGVTVYVGVLGRVGTPHNTRQDRGIPMKEAIVPSISLIYSFTAMVL